jgi:hypothetical protein
MTRLLDCLAWIALGSLLIIAIGLLPPARDDSDPPNGRSGMTPLVDAKTGCEYLIRGGLIGATITPRMGADGKQVCRPTPAGSSH